MNFVSRAYICLVLCCYGAVAGDENLTIRFGIAPFSSAASIVKTHRPLRDYLSERLSSSVVIYTSVNHEAFLNDGLENRFDLIATPAHFAPFFIEKGFVPLVKYKTPLDLIFVVRNDSAIAKISDLKGKRVGIPDYLSLYYVVGARWLNEHKAQIGDYAQVREPGHAAAISSVAAGKIDAAITGTPPFTLTAASFRSRLKAIEFEKVELPSLITMAHQSLGEETIAKLQAALKAFHTTKEGEEFFHFMGYDGYLTVTPSDIESANAFRPYVEQALKDNR